MAIDFFNGQIADTASLGSDVVRVSVPNLTQLDRAVHGPMRFEPAIQPNGTVSFPKRGDDALICRDNISGDERLVSWRPSAVPSGPILNDIGSLLFWSRRILPSDLWAIADGSSFAQAQWPDAYDVAVNEVAAGNPLWAVNAGAHTFAIPNFTDKFIYSRAAANVGTFGGAASVTLDTTQIPSHSHGGVTGTDSPDHAHTTGPGVINNAAGAPATITGGSYGVAQVSTGGASARHAHGISAQGGGLSHENMPPYLAAAVLVKLGYR